MHPASSLIVFTTLSGVGFGVIALLGFGFGPDDAIFGWIACILGGGLCVAGLLASTLHLGHPERAWRAFSQWRSSWLSREGVVAVAALIIFAVYAGLWLFFGVRSAWLGVPASLLAVATVYCTAMIYASLKTVPRWYRWGTPAMFLAYAAAGGWLAAGAVQVFRGTVPTTALVGAALALAASTVWGWWMRSGDRLGLAAAASLESATGLAPLGRVRLLEAPHTAPNYLMTEMVFRLGRKHADKLRRIALLLLAPVCMTVLLLAAVLEVPVLVPLAFGLHLAGAVVSRWLFFAEAEHTVALYYGHG